MRPVLKVLLRSGAIDAKQVEATETMIADGVHPVAALIHAGADEKRIAVALAAALGAPLLDVVRADAGAMGLIPDFLIREHLCLPIQRDGDRRLVLAMVDPSDVDAIERARFASGLTILPRTVTLSDYREAVASGGLVEGIWEDTPVVIAVNISLLEAARRQPFSIRIDRARRTASGPPWLPDVSFSMLCDMVERIREMCGDPLDRNYGGIHLRAGDVEFYLAAHFTPDDSLTTVRGVTIEEFASAFGGDG